MPAGTKVAKAEAALKAGAKKKGFTGKRADKYVFGALNNMGMMRGNKMTKKGMAKAKTVLT
jgi:hypothetical protein